MNESPLSPSTARTSRILALLLLGVTALVFAPGVFGNFVWDDKPLIVQGPSTVWEAITSSFWDAETDGHIQTGARYYRPVISAAYVLQRSFFGLDPLGFHLVSLLLHLACVLLGYRWVLRRIGARTPAALVAAALACALFALHPSRPESVTWIAGSTDLWMTFWLLAALECWDRKAAAWRLAAVPPLILSVLSKEATFIVPALLLIDARALYPAPERRRETLWALGMGGVLAVVLLVRLVAIPIASLGVGHASIGEGFAQVTTSIGYYVSRTLAPWPPSVQLGLMHPDGTYAYPAFQMGLGILVLAAGLALAALALRRASLRPWLADACWWALPLLPVINIVPLGYQVLAADRFLYLPLFGASAFLARALARLLRDEGSRRTVAIAALGGATGLAGIVSTLHVGNLYDDVTLWRYELSLDPDHPRLLLRLSSALWADRELEEAAALALRAFDRTTDDLTRIRAAGDWAAIRSEMLADSEQKELRALRAFYEAIATGESDRYLLGTPTGSIEVPLTTEARNWMRSRAEWATYRAIFWARTGNLDAAEGILREVLEKKPNPEAYGNLMLVVGMQERWNDALAIAEEAKARFPEAGPVEVMASKIARLAGRSLPVEPELAAAERAYRLLELGNGLLARGVLAGVISGNPSRPELVSLAVNAEIMLRAWDRAAAVVATARRHAPEQASTWDRFDQRIVDAKAAFRSPDAPPHAAAAGASLLD